LFKAVPRFTEDIQALQRLMKADKPPLEHAWCKRTVKAYYGFGDASRSGFGVTIQIGKDIHYEYGQWCLEVMEEKSSN
jgi:hypothetical protein